MKKRILVVEYDARTVDLIRDTFPPSAFDLIVVDEGQKARDELSRGTFDLVITAAMLPKFHGFNLSQFIHDQYPSTHVIIMSGIYKEMEYKRQAITQYNADDFFQKPLNPDTLRKRVFELLDMDNQSQSAAAPEATMEFPVADTSKMPSIQEAPAVESDRFSSEDLFGDIIEKVESEDAVTSPEPPQKQAQPPNPPATKIQPKKEHEEEAVLALTDEDMVAVSPQTVEIPQNQNQPPSFKAITSDDIDASLNDLLSDQPAKKPDTQRFRKIEEDFSKKFEDTLSGLGLDKKHKRPDPGPQATAAKPPAAPPVAPPRQPAPAAADQPDLRTREMPRPTEPPQDPKASSSDLGDYDILGLIARGGMAEIYKAKKKGVKGFEKVLAIKKILSGYGQDDKYIEMFVDEAKIAAELTHPNIVQIYDLGKKDDYYFIAMEYVQGKDLRLILKRTAGTDRVFPEELAVYMIIKVLEALNYAHSAKDSKGRNLEIVHRDISPPNIMISYGGEVKLTDFGVSKATIKVHQTLSGALKGKLLYMSPEQARAERDIDHRSDLYSVGIIFFELLTGQKLFMETSEMKVLKRVQQGQITLPEEIGVTLDAELERILLKSLKLEREERYQSASDMLSDLESYLLSRYDHIPGYLHLAHFMNELFQEDMSSEGVKLALKPLPYHIKRLQTEPAEPPVSRKTGDQADIHVETTQPEGIPPDARLSDEVESADEAAQEPEIEFVSLDEEQHPIQPQLETDIPAAPAVHGGEASGPDFKPEPETFEPEEVEELEEVEPEDKAEAPLKPIGITPQSTAASPPAASFAATPGQKPAAGITSEQAPTFEIKLDEEIPDDKYAAEDSINLEKELAALDKGSARRSKAFLWVLLSLAVVAAGVIWYMTSRTGEPQSQLTPSAAEISRQQAQQPAETAEDATNAALSETATDAGESTLPEPPAVTGQETESSAAEIRPEALAKKTESEKAPSVKPRIDSKPAAELPTLKKPEARKPEPQPRETTPQSAAVRGETQTRQPSATSEKPAAVTPKPIEKKDAPATAAETEPQPAAEDAMEEKPATPPVETAAEEVKPAEPAPAQEVVTEGQIASSVDTLPVAVSTPYPEISRRALRGLKQNATVVISFLVNHFGKVERIKFIRRSGVPDIDMEIARTVSNWTYRPAIKQGKKVKLWQTKSIAIKK
ncbi:MAG: protein kinase [Acidobacteriota bacterium]|jgi:TonB family protein|nr:protein kinase [Acidobacteriota bacterium]